MCTHRKANTPAKALRRAECRVRGTKMSVLNAERRLDAAEASLCRVYGFEAINIADDEATEAEEAFESAKARLQAAKARRDRAEALFNEAFAF